MHRSKLELGWIAALAVVLLGASAEAESPKNWVLEAQFGSYQPEIDRGLTGSPFRDVFGDDRSLLAQAALQRLVFQEFGTLGVGVQSGYTEFFGRAFIEGTNERSGDNTSLHVIPLTFFASYRFDVLAERLDIPFAVYGKAGLGYWFWWSNDGRGNTAGDGDASGTKAGVVLSAGIALQLDWFDPRLSNEFDREFGVNNTYLYFDYTNWNAKFRANVFKHGIEAQGLDLSDEILSGGIAFEF